MATLDEQRARTPGNSFAMDLDLVLRIFFPSDTITRNIPFDVLPLWLVERRHGATVSREKSVQAFPPIFLQSCKTKAGTESLGLRLLKDSVAV